MQRTILITGCSSGIGLACAKGMRDRGWRVFATARTQADLNMLEREGFIPVHLDLEDQASIAACAERVLAETDGKLDVLFNNAAYGQIGAVEDIPINAMRRQFEVNVFSWHELTNRLLPAMIERGEGRIVQCSSVLGFVSGPYRGPYAASKFAIEALSDSYRAELAGTGITVSLIEPGPIQSRFVDHAADSLEREVDIEASRHADLYKARIKGLRSGGKSRWKLEPEAVLKRLIHAAESPRPKVRYYVTVPTYMAALAKRVLPNGLFAAFVARN